MHGPDKLPLVIGYLPSNIFTHELDSHSSLLLCKVQTNSLWSKFPSPVTYWLELTSCRQKMYIFENNNWTLVNSYLVSKLLKTIQNLELIKNRIWYVLPSSQLTIHEGMLNSTAFSASQCSSGCSPIFSERCLASPCPMPSTLIHHFRKFSLTNKDE